ncbi:hypothetical protein EVAR_11491_1 [Eumeta japonica]|uniref:Uncharacterized protein n=1 Tax=Eumeta variegata TaxID=151549 RepID=A0A4C1TYM9_EUMVA|nr:hypothetical protein EVAR_11491_1 [Eumeta japonica]
MQKCSVCEQSLNAFLMVSANEYLDILLVCQRFALEIRGIRPRDNFPSIYPLSPANCGDKSPRPAPPAALFPGTQIFIALRGERARCDVSSRNESLRGINIWTSGKLEPDAEVVIEETPALALGELATSWTIFALGWSRADHEDDALAPRNALTWSGRRAARTNFPNKLLAGARTRFDAPRLRQREEDNAARVRRAFCADCVEFANKKN